MSHITPAMLPNGRPPRARPTGESIRIDPKAGALSSRWSARCRTLGGGRRGLYPSPAPRLSVADAPGVPAIPITTTLDGGRPGLQPAQHRDSRRRTPRVPAVPGTAPLNGRRPGVPASPDFRQRTPWVSPVPGTATLAGRCPGSSQPSIATRGGGRAGFQLPRHRDSRWQMPRAPAIPITTTLCGGRARFPLPPAPRPRHAPDKRAPQPCPAWALRG